MLEAELGPDLALELFSHAALRAEPQPRQEALEHEGRLAAPLEMVSCGFKFWRS